MKFEKIKYQTWILTAVQYGREEFTGKTKSECLKKFINWWNKEGKQIYA